jgi:hypothetical protein
MKTLDMLFAIAALSAVIAFVVLVADLFRYVIPA